MKRAFLHLGWFPVLLACAATALAQPATPGPGAEQAPPPGIWERDTLTGDWGGLRSRLGDNGITLGLQEQEQVWANLAGGVHTGTAYDGLTVASVKVDLEKLAGWSGATFFVNAYQIHGRGPTTSLVGNLQVVSNLEATADTKLYALWLEQKLIGGRLTLRIGQEGANDQMMLTQYGALFLNSSFGFPGLAAIDLPSGGPNFPLATPFVRAEFQATDQLSLVGAVFNGDPAPPGVGDPQRRDAGGTAFRLSGHALSFGELWYSVNQGEQAAGLPGTYKLGAWIDSAHFADQLRATNQVPLASPASNGVAVGHSPTFAIYAIADQMVWREPGTKDQGIGVFLEVMGAPAAYNLSNLFIAGGVNWKGMLPDRGDDTFGLGVSYLGISPAARRYSRDVIAYTGSGVPYANNETVLEATYQVQVTPWWILQPDVQYIINPGAGIPSAYTTRALKNAVAAGLHTAVTF